jgi:hypothetical protein
MFPKFKLPWYPAYCRAVLESNPELADAYIQDAMAIMNERLIRPDLGDYERQALSLAFRYLTLIKSHELKKAS